MRRGRWGGESTSSPTGCKCTCGSDLSVDGQREGPNSPLCKYVALKKTYLAKTRASIDIRCIGGSLLGALLTLILVLLADAFDVDTYSCARVRCYR